MNQFNAHNYALRDFFEFFLDDHGSRELKEMVDLDSIDGILRKCLSIEEMREAGSFFTGQRLSTAAVLGFTKAITLNSVVLDPTCGAGNLLIEVSRQLGVEQSLLSTLTAWGAVLRGYDLHKSFIEAAKLRIVLEALNRGAEKDCSLDSALQLLSGIKVKDAMLVGRVDLADVTHVIMNPPFSNWKSPKINFWKTGKVNAASVVFEHYVRNLPLMCQISAILPDVLRSGSRYEGWRGFISQNFCGDCELAGLFNAKTDVDVFLLRGALKSDCNDVSWFPRLGDYIQLSEQFDVCVGPLVAYRDPLIGLSHPYIHSKNAPLWKTVKQFDEYRQFPGRVIKPPFVVIRRTSRPDDKYRASGTIISGKMPVAVENHMIVIKPKRATLKECRKLLKIFKSSLTNDFLNDRIRCRHLTVGIVNQIPIIRAIPL